MPRHITHRERVYAPIDEDTEQNSNSKSKTVVAIPRPCLLSPSKLPEMKGLEASNMATENGRRKTCCSARCLLRSSSISASTCVGVDSRDYKVGMSICWLTCIFVGRSHIM